EKNIYLSNFARFEKSLGQKLRSPLHKLRKTALHRFADLGFPTARDEEWRFTSVAPIAKIPFKTVAAYERNDLSAERVERVDLGWNRRSGSSSSMVTMRKNSPR